MVKVINIDTKTKTIHISNADGDIKTWRTTESGTHFPIREGESTKEALDKFVGSKRPEAKKDSGLLGDRYDAKHGTKTEKSSAPLLGDRPVKDVTQPADTPKPGITWNLTEKQKKEFAEAEAKETQKRTKEDDQLDDLHYNYGTDDDKDLMKAIEEHYVNQVAFYGKDSKDAKEAMRDYQKASRLTGLPMNDDPMKGRTLETEPDQPTHPDDPRDSEAGTDDNFHALWEKYVPDEGTADTLFGEMLRAAGRIRYRYYNDGDMYGYGYGKETVNNAISYLSKLAGGRDTEFKKELDRALYQATTAAAHYDEDEYKRQVDRIADAFASASWDDIQALASVKNNTDSLTEYPDDTSYDDDDEDEEW